MQVIHERCAGLDVHKKTVVACVITPQGQQTRTFRTMLAALARGRLQRKVPALAEAAHGLMGPHQRMMLKSQLHHLEFLGSEIEHLDQEVALRLQPLEGAIERIDEIPGIGRRIAEEVLVEIGADMERFPTAAHLASWAGVCPGNNESAGKRKSGATGRGNPWLRSALVEGAWAAARTKGNYLAAR